MELIEDVIDESIKMVTNLDKNLNNAIWDWDYFKELFMRYRILMLSMKQYTYESRKSLDSDDNIYYNKFLEYNEDQSLIY